MATKIYYPEMNEEKPQADIEAHLSYYGKHYFLATNLELKGRGIKEVENSRQDGKRSYKVTIRAYEKLEKEYTISREALLD